MNEDIIDFFLPYSSSLPRLAVMKSLEEKSPIAYAMRLKRERY
jgi:hypothetical protein